MDPMFNFNYSFSEIHLTYIYNVVIVKIQFLQFETLSFKRNLSYVKFILFSLANSFYS